MITDCLWGGVPTYTYAKCVPYPWYRGVTTASTVCVCVCVRIKEVVCVCVCVRVCVLGDERKNEDERIIE